MCAHVGIPLSFSSRGLGRHLQVPRTCHQLYPSYLKNALRYQHNCITNMIGIPKEQNSPLKIGLYAAYIWAVTLKYTNNLTTAHQLHCSSLPISRSHDCLLYG